MLIDTKTIIYKDSADQLREVNTALGNIAEAIPLVERAGLYNAMFEIRQAAQILTELADHDAKGSE